MDARLQSVLDDFAKDTDAETNGRWVPYKGKEYRIARAYRTNKNFSTTFEKEMKPFRRVIEAGHVDSLKDVAAEKMYAVYSTAVFLGVRDADGEIPCTAEDRAGLLRDRPDLWDFVHRFATDAENFGVTETERKN